jgi:hypothetical protein
MPKTNVIFAPEFAAPSLHVGLEVMLLLAKTMREAFERDDAAGCLEGENYSWIDAIGWLGSAAAREVPQFQKVIEIADLWKSFLAKAEIRNLPRDSLAVLTRARNRSVNAARKKASRLSDFDVANATAYQKVRAVLTPHKIHDLLPLKPVSIDVVYDAEGKEYCASASRLTGKIRWAYQPQLAHLLHGLIILEYLFAHEYLSHLVPRNPHLDLTIQERWLVVALRRGIIHDPNESYWKRVLWTTYRNALVRYVQREEERLKPDSMVTSFFGASLVEDSALELYLANQPSFWGITTEVLGQGDDPVGAKRASKAVEGLGRVQSQLNSNKVYKIKDLIELM